jgi:dsDNA-binding SOS-regulon protein
MSDRATELLTAAAFCLEEAKGSSLSLHIAKLIREFLAKE